ncbi:MAG: deoxynucleoside kinase [Gammaproteobacteria bacterium]
MWPGRYRFVVIEGPIGVGKTTLARALAKHSGAELVLEQPMDNPFLERFYKDPRGAALPTQLHFLFQRARQCQDMRQADLFEPLRVSDFLLDKDRLFAQLTLDDDELALYEMVYEKLAIDAPKPDLVIYLQASVPVLVGRIRERGIDYEQRITENYLQRLSDTYTRFFHHYATAPLLIVNTDNANLADDSGQFERLVEQVQTLRSGRQFYNPAGDAPL